MQSNACSSNDKSKRDELTKIFFLHKYRVSKVNVVKVNPKRSQSVGGGGESVGGVGWVVGAVGGI